MTSQVLREQECDDEMKMQKARHGMSRDDVSTELQYIFRGLRHEREKTWRRRFKPNKTGSNDNTRLRQFFQQQRHAMRLGNKVCFETLHFVKLLPNAGHNLNFVF